MTTHADAIAPPSSMAPRIAARAQWVIIAAIAGLAFFPFIGQRDIVTSHEARVAQTARLMAASGSPWSATTIQVPAVRPDRSNGMLRLAWPADGNQYTIQSTTTLGASPWQTVNVTPTIEGPLNVVNVPIAAAPL